MSKIFIIIFLAAFTGFTSGLLSSGFLHSLEYVTIMRNAHPELIWGLPFFGLILAYVIQRIPHHVNQGVPYFLKELHNNQAPISVGMIPFIFLSALGTHLFGGSAGREGVGIILGVGTSQIFPHVHKVFKELRTHLIYAGISGGFASIFGTPLAAIVIAFEFHHFKDIKKIELVLSSILSSLCGYIVFLYLSPMHIIMKINIPDFKEAILYVLVAGLMCGLAGQFCYWGLKGYGKLISYILPSLHIKLFVGGLIISSLVYFTNSFEYIGIGTDLITRSLNSQMELYDFFMKCLLTVMTLSIGFKGGEVTPLFCMGATLSNSVSSFFGLTQFSLSASLGMMSLFGAVTASPLASAVMGGELFGVEVGLLCFASCGISRLLMLKKSVYRL